jgi:hypothetical protein
MQMTIDLILVGRSCDCVLVHTILFKLSFHHYIHFDQHTAIVDLMIIMITGIQCGGFPQLLLAICRSRRLVTPTCF